MLREADTTRSFMNRIPKRQATFCGHVMRREKLEDLETTGMIVIKRSSGKQREKILDDLQSGSKIVNVAQATRCTESDEGQRCVEGHDRLR